MRLRHHLGSAVVPGAQPVHRASRRGAFRPVRPGPSWPSSQGIPTPRPPWRTGGGSSVPWNPFRDLIPPRALPTGSWHGWVHPERQRSGRQAVVRARPGPRIADFRRTAPGARQRLDRSALANSSRAVRPHVRNGRRAGRGPFLVTLHHAVRQSAADRLPTWRASCGSEPVRPWPGCRMRSSQVLPANPAMGRIVGILEGWVPSGPAMSAGLAVFGRAHP